MGESGAFRRDEVGPATAELGRGHHAGWVVTDRRAVPQWMGFVLAGVVAWGTALVVMVLTDNVRLLPPIILLAGFLVPVTFLIWVAERAGRTDGSALDLPNIVRGFLAGGALGLLAAAQLDAYVQPEVSVLLIVGLALLWELAKLLVLLGLSGRVRQGRRRNPELDRWRLQKGLVLGAAIGLGFGAFEGTGLAMASLFTAGDLTLQALAETELLRGILVPAGNGLFTAILGGVVATAVRARREPVAPAPSAVQGWWRTLRVVALAYLGVSLLHALWDSMGMLAVSFTGALTAAAWPAGVWRLGYLDPTETQIHLAAILDWLGLVLVGVVGLFWLGNLRRREQDRILLARPAGPLPHQRKRPQ